jgi:hypothetical protein
MILFPLTKAISEIRAGDTVPLTKAISVHIKRSLHLNSPFTAFAPTTNFTTDTDPTQLFQFEQPPRQFIVFSAWLDI